MPESTFSIVVQPFVAKECSSLHVVMDGVPFPDGEWRDFVFDLLGTWCRESCEISENAAQVHYFLDGPWSIEARLENSLVTLTCQARRGATWPGIPPSCKVPLDEYRRVILRANIEARDAALNLGLPLTDAFLKQLARLEHLLEANNK